MAALRDQLDPSGGERAEEPERQRRAAGMAERMLLAHFPAKTPFTDWADEATGWTGLKTSRALKSHSEPSDRLERSEWERVYLYAGPSCYDEQGAIGDAALFFPAGAASGTGEASPFDSGALGSTARPRLQPWASSLDPDARWSMLEEHSVPLDVWRTCFALWLQHCYDDPDRYLDTTGDRDRDGLPDRTVPEEILSHNGAAGRERYGAGSYADRRAWTWEVRVQKEIPFEEVAVLLVPKHHLQQANALADRLQRLYDGDEIVARPYDLGPDDDSGADAIYRASGPLVASFASG